MPKQKDLKRLIRARMEKTGESYTAARAQILGADVPLLPDDYQKLAGMSDDAVRKATGRTWPEWAEWLDGHDAATWEHAQIADFIYDQGGEVSGWWSQMVAVAYERFRGLREYGQRRGGGYDVNKSKTVGVSLDALWTAFADDDARARWLADPGIDFHRKTEPKSMRGAHADGTKIDVYFTAKGDAKSAVSVQHRELPDKESAEAARAAWAERLDRLKAMLSG